MNTYRTYLTVTNPGQLTLTDLPFQSGQTVEILIRPQKKKTGKSLKALQKLFKETQKLPQIQTITEEDIQAEIAGCRSSK
ncbi:Uncharacterized protein dnl_58720 [Desulfonema limicola]|uniref:Uncharacterized protein n=1 Tax=Desulfonema limicola TaxID=45656 RepID=A0A975BDP1_9BACT|nr:hypothetical protein [Desulfonema limicola]QTA83462.1 Uncharacterized protein dnl_58720 [Desulfonema limicola]